MHVQSNARLYMYVGVCVHLYVIHKYIVTYFA